MTAKICVVEDDYPIASMYEFKLRQQGYEVRTALDGVTGFNLIKEIQPALILLDLRMPGMNGDELLEKLRATEWGSKIRVVILTNTSRDEAPHKLRFLNVDSYIVKAHHTPQQVVDIIKDVLA